MARSPSPRRSKGPGTPSQVTADLALGSRRRRTPSPAKARGRGRSPKTPDDSAVIPFLSTTPTPPPAAAKKSPAKKGANSATKKVAGGEMAAAAQTKSRRARRSATISPRARGTAIASILASPGDLPLAHGAAGIANRFVSPSQRSAAEAALNRLARGAKSAAGVGDKAKTKGRRKRGTSLDSLLASSAGVLGMGGTDATPTVPGKRRRRKAASDASAKVHAMSAKDELDRPPGSADKIFYKKAPVGRRKKGDVQPAPPSSDNGGAAPAGERAKPAATSGTGGFAPKNKVDERWLRNFQKWTASQKHSGDDNAAALTGLSPLPKKWARDQRAHYRRWMKEEKTNMTREKVALLEAAGFEWEGKSGRPGHKKAEKGGGEEKRGRSGKGAGKARVDVSPSARKFGSPERKSPRRSPPTQFYHNLGAASSDVGNVDTGKTASTQDGPKSSGEPTPGTPPESPSQRKSPRKSPPTQFYHNLGAASSDKGDSTARKSLLPKLNAVTTPGTKDSEESGSKNGRPLSPSKRLSVNGESLASVGAKSKSDGKGKKKKRRFRGSGGSASLSALGPMQTGEPAQPSAKKAKGSLSYEELEAELKKKGKKKPIAKKEGETAKKKQSAKKAKGKVTKDGEGPAAKAQAPSAVKESEEVAASHFSSSSAANKAGPSSAPPSSPPAETAPTSSAANDASTEKRAVPEAVCVTKLLLSCLSEDSAEKTQPSGSAPIYAPQNTVEQEAEEPGNPTAASSPTKDVVAEQPSQPQKESSPSPAAKKKRGRPRKHPLPSQLQKESAPAPQDPSAEEERSRSWTCDVCNEATFADYDQAVAHEKECVKAKDAEGAPVEQREEAATEEAVDSWTCDVCRKATFGDYDEAVAHERECRGRQGRARKQSSSLAEGSEADSQPTPLQHIAPVDETALAQFSPLSLTSPLQANNLMDSRYSSNGRGAPFPPSHIGGTQFHPVTAVVPNQTMNLVQNVNLNVSLPPGMLPTSEGHAQMILAERQYQEKMAEFGRLELEAKMVTDRMREIEERIEGIDSSAIAADVDAGRQIEETVSRKRSYRETHHYESSEADYSDEHRSPRKRRRRKRAAEETITMKRVKVRSSSSRRGDQLESSQSSYDNEHIVLKSSSRSPKKADRGRAYDSPDEYEDRPARSTPGSRKKSKAKRPAQVGRKSPSRLRKASPKRRQKSSLEVSGEVEKSPHMPREEIDDEGSAPHDDDASNQPPEEKEMNKTSEMPPAEDQDDQQKEEAASSNAKAKDGKDERGPSQPAQARDPLYWLAGGENSSDDESWDFDGPMILPPPPIG